MYSYQKDSNNSVNKLNEASSSFVPSSLSSPGAPPPPPPPPLPSPRVRDIPPSLCFQPAVPTHALYKICSNLQPPPLRRWRNEARTGVANQHSKKTRKPQLEPKPNTQTTPRPPPPLPQPPTLIPKPTISTLPRLTPKPALDDLLPSPPNKKSSAGAFCTVVTLREKRIKIIKEDVTRDDNKPMESQSTLSGDSKTKNGQNDKNMKLTPERRVLRARHGGGGIKPQGNCSQPSLYTHRPVKISSAVPLNVIRPSVLPLNKPCTSTTAQTPTSTFAVPTAEPNVLSTDSQASSKLAPSSFAPGNQQMDQCVPTGLPVNRKKKSSTVSSSSIASILMPPPPSTIPLGQRTLTKAAKKPPALRPGLLTVQEQVRAACTILRRAEKIRKMTDRDRRALVAHVLNSLCKQGATGQRLYLGSGTFLILRDPEHHEPTQQTMEEDSTSEKSDGHTE